ncbi:MAG: cytochrome d ubiquinol oxidase subunit II [Eubacteriales bacterium]|nr:cytochrome d ubiquinol oxidase subunit II [Eubacteriales bacterium]
MELNTLWFILIGVLFAGFFFLEGFDYGVMMLMPFLGKKEEERRVLINTIGPVWDGNEVWLLTAGGAMFAAFPNWYATMFSGFYLALFLILVALIFRSVAFEFRSKMAGKRWRSNWDLALSVGSLIPALLFGVAFGDLINGVPIDANMEFVGNFFSLLAPYALLTGVLGLVFFLYHGAVFITLKTVGDLKARASMLSKKLGIASLVVWAGVVVVSYFVLESKLLMTIFAVLATVALVTSLYFQNKDQNGKAMIANAVTTLTVVGAFFAGLYPNVMVSSLDLANNLTVATASSTPYTLKIMTIITVTVLPIVLGYQIWSYYIFRKRVTGDKLEY